MIWITLINYGYINYTKNFLKSIKKANIDFKLHIYCFNYQECLDELNKFKELNDYDNFVCIDANNFITEKMTSELCCWSKMDYKKIVFCKLDAIKYALENNPDIDVGYIDMDIVLFSDPTKVILEYMDKYPNVDIFGQCDEPGIECLRPTNCSNMCSGVIVFRNKPELYDIFNYDVKDLSRFMGDQDFIGMHRKMRNIKSITIDRRIFLNGTFPGIKNDDIIFQKPKTTSLIHFNWMIGNKKESRMKKLNMWFI
jgi:hypothetical protein